MSRKILVIGSGPIVIGQAAEFDYSGSQALQILKEEGISTVLVNPNPATIMTDKDMADKVYLEPLDVETLKKIIIKESPTGILSSFGGQTALNLSKKLAESGFLERENVRLLGSDLKSIKYAEDRFLFREKMIEMGVPVPPGIIVSNLEQAKEYAAKEGFPLIVRPAYTLGGSGGGLVNNLEDFLTVLSRGLDLSSIGQCLVERSIKGLKEIEFEVIRDREDNSLAICHMENIDPVGIHTGESIVVAPIQSLADTEIQFLRTMSLKIVSELNIIGACNVQLAHCSDTNQSYVIEVNPRVSRSSALASKATGYPIAKVATHVALDKTIDKILNPITGNTFASFEPTLDYVVVKIPRWPFDKFRAADKTLSTQMKSTGEVMSIGRNFSEAFLKAIRSLELKNATNYFNSFKDIDTKELKLNLKKHTCDWYLELLELLRRHCSLDEIHEITKISHYFLYRLKCITDLEKKIESSNALDETLLRELKTKGFSNSTISYFSKQPKIDISSKLKEFNIKPVVKSVDSCAGEFEASTPYYYQSYGSECDAGLVESTKKKVVVLGSGPIRIGQGIEFDYSCVHSLLKLREEGIETIMINNNPETCSTDFSLSDKLYFEPLYDEDVLNILHREKPDGVIVQFGGQTSLKLTESIHNAGFTILGTSLDSINMAEDRDKFETLLDELEINRPKACIIQNKDFKNDSLSYPVIVRPSYVLGGAHMEVLYTEKELNHYLERNESLLEDHAILVDEYIKGKEIEVDALCDGDNVCIPGIMEHVERAGVHSGDSISVFPPQNLFTKVQEEVVQTTIKIAKALNVKGILNIQYTFKKGKLYILEVNPRASRTVPFLSKMTELPMAKIATGIMLGKTLKELNVLTGLLKEPDFISVKVPVFSFDKVLGAEVALGPEMKSTGEVLGVDKNFELALLKGLVASGVRLPSYGRVLMTISDRYKEDALELAKELDSLGYKIIATKGTKSFFEANSNLNVDLAHKINEANIGLDTLIKSRKVDMVVNTLSQNKKSNSDGFKLRRLACENSIPCFTSLDTMSSIIGVLKFRDLSVKGL